MESIWEGFARIRKKYSGVRFSPTVDDIYNHIQTQWYILKATDPLWEGSTEEQVQKFDHIGGKMRMCEEILKWIKEGK